MFCQQFSYYFRIKILKPCYQGKIKYLVDLVFRTNLYWNVHPVERDPILLYFGNVLCQFVKVLHASRYVIFFFHISS
jgi:hypothetical protein